MNIGLYDGAMGMSVNWAHQHAVAGNLASQAVPGHKQSITSFQIPSDLSQAGKQVGGKTDQSRDLNLFSGPIQVKHHIDFAQGPIKRSDNPLHFAIQGDAFFMVREKDGSVSYTRNGEFFRGEGGEVKTSDGAEVLLEGESPFVISKSSDVVVSEDGTVLADGNSSGKLGMVYFESPEKVLQIVQNGRFQLKEGEEGKRIDGAASYDRVSQFHLEHSNTQPITQMVNLMQVMRTYEANQKAVITHDEVISRLIRTVGGGSA